MRGARRAGSCARVLVFAMERIRVRSGSGSYAVACGRGALGRAGALLHGVAGGTRIFLLSSARVWKHCGRKIQSHLRANRTGGPILFSDRERAKNLATVERVCRQLVRAGADRRALLVAVGGGVVGDVAGFVAASYLRGVGLVHVPTTVVAQVDSAIGGKTGVNLPEGKNLVGAFYPPRLVVVDPELLWTLPAREYRSGLYEVIKYGVIGDAKLFRFLEQRMDELLQRRKPALDWVVPRCIRAKVRVVSRDERERGPRRVLNFGHTVGHALEAATGYRKYLHGEAVGWGMLGATEIAARSERLDPGEAARIARLIARVGPLPRPRSGELTRALGAMRADKKAVGGQLRWVLPRRIGKVEFASDVPERLVRAVLNRLPDLLPR